MREVLSVVVPLHNEREVLGEFHRRLIGAVGDLDVDVEIIYVDDGSADGTTSLLSTLAADDHRIRAVSLSRNFGHQLAVTAGLERARGDAVVIIDGDLQDPPELIPQLLDRYRNGSEVVHAVRMSRDGETILKRKTAASFYRAIRKATDLDIQLDAGDYRLLGRRAVDAICAMPEQFRFLRGMAVWVGFRQSVVPYDRDRRFAGTSKYPVSRMAKLASTAFTSFSFVPLQIVSLLGFALSALSVVSIPIVIALRLAGVKGLGGQTTVLLAVLLLGGIQLLSLGVIGEYVGRIAIEVKHRPLYVVASDSDDRPPPSSG